MYQSLSQIVRYHGLTLPKPREGWRLVNPPVCGEIQGIPTMRGRAIATNGILVLIEDELETAFFGHLEWFNKDKDEPSVLDEAIATAKRQPRAELQVASLVAELEQMFAML